mgnify:CR=1 FL=1
MTQKVMYPGLVNSPETTLTNGISETDTLIYVLDPARVPEPPNLMTLGTGTNAETVLVTAINDNALTVQRGFQGIAKAWPAGTVIARNFTEYDYGALKDNIEDLDASKETPAGAQAKAEAAAGAVQAELAAHKAENVSKVVMVTEPFDQTTKTTVNLGFKPKMVTIDAIIFNTIYESHGSSDGINQYLRFRIVADNVLSYDSPAVIVEFFHTSSAYIIGACTFTNDGIEITWTKVGTLPDVSGNRILIISAITHGEG